MTVKDQAANENIHEEFDHFGEYKVEQKVDKRFGNETLIMFKAGQNKYGYQRLHGQKLLVEKFIVSEETLSLSIVPVAPLYTPEMIADRVMLKLTAPLVLEPKSYADAYLTMPIEIGVVMSIEENSEVIDAFSVGLQLYAIYGTPEDGILCRYHLTRLSSEPSKLRDYEEALVRVHFLNHTDKIVAINKIVFPVKGVDFYYNHKDAFFRDLHVVVESKLANTVAIVGFTQNYEFNGNKTSLNQEHEDKFVMEWGF
jgi:hypothetical protein